MYLKEFKIIFKNKKNIIYFLVLFFVIFWTFKIIPNSHILLNYLKMEDFAVWGFLGYFWETTIGVMKYTSWNSNFMDFLLPFFMSLNIIFFKELYQKQKFILKYKGFFGSISGMVLGLFGVGCASCTGLLLAPVISFLGLTKFFNILPYGGAEFGYIGLIFIIISNIYLLKKISEPSVCKV